MTELHEGLRVQGLSHSYGGVRALEQVGFEVMPGQCVALIGPNGAGKSTCFAALAGQHEVRQGQVIWRGQSLLHLPSHERLLRGVARTFQVAQLFEALTVQQSLQLCLKAPQGLAWSDRLDDQLAAPALTLLDQVGLSSVAQTTVQDLAYGAKKRLELAMALAGLHATGHHEQGILLLDEPAAGLGPQERAQMMALVRDCATQGLAVLYTEHNMDAVFGVADRVIVLMRGRVVCDGLPQEVVAHPEVRVSYLGDALQGWMRRGGRHA
jgi:branched-chain amino acid transport system ATP-binding protein